MYNCVTRLRSQTAASASESIDSVSWCKSFIIYANYYIKWLLLVFLEIFSGSLSGRDDLVVSDSLDGNECFICKCFMRYSSFVHKLNSHLCVETDLVHTAGLNAQISDVLCCYSHCDLM